MRVRSKPSLAIAVLAFAWLMATGAIAQKWCARPSGAAIQAAVYSDTARLLPLLNKLAGNRRFVVLRKPEQSNLGDQKAFVDAYGEAVPETAREQGWSEDRIQAYMSKVPEFAESTLNELKYNGEMQDSDGSITKTAYVYSNSPSFENERGKKGATIEGTPEQFEKLLISNGENEPPLVYQLIKDWGAKIIFVSGFDISKGFIDGLPSGYSVIRLPERLSEAEGNLAAIVMGSSERDITVLFAMPTREEEARAWGFDAQKAADYAAAGAKALKKVRASGATVVELQGLSPDTIASKAEALKAQGAQIVILGEGADGGTAFRLPGQSEPYRLDQHGSAMNDAMLMFCNSELAQLPGAISVVGRIYIDEATRIVSALAGDKPQPKAGDRIQIDDFLAADNRISNWLRDVAAASTRNELVVYRYAYIAPCGSPGAEPCPPEEPPVPAGEAGGSAPKSPPWPVFFGYGALGGSAKEFLRWRSLVLRGRGPRYQAPLFILLSGGFILFAGAVGALFAPISPYPAFAPIIAFTAGVGLEEIVRLASKLKVWAPNVPLGGESDLPPLGPKPKAATKPPTVLEFLRR
jgi:hypothetical protein